MESNSVGTREQGYSPTAQGVRRACDMCRKKKIRCEPTGNTCFQCIKYKTHCHFTPVSNKRRPRKPAGHKHVEKLEERLKKMESFLQAVMEGGRIKKKFDLKQNGPFGVLNLKQNRGDGFLRPEDMGMQLGLETCAETAWRKVMSTYEAPISTRSISGRFQDVLDTPKPGAPIINMASMTLEKPTPLWKGSLVKDVLSRHAFRELPSKSVALVLINEAFRSFNYSFPIFDQRSFMTSVHERYSDADPNDPGWWASINVVIALAHRFRAMRTLETSQENGEACGYMQNALAVVSELTMLHNNLPAIQALLGMTIVLQGTPNPRLCSVLIAAAMRLAQKMGLHRKNRDPSLTEAEREQRKRVFWIAYFLDKDISLRTGQPPAQDDDDMDIELPLHTLSDLPLDSSGLSTIDIFNYRIGLAIIQGQVYKRLYSAKALRQSKEDQLLAARELDACIAAWRNSVPIDFGEDALATLQPPIAPDLLHMIILRFTYVNCLIAIHRPFPSNDSETVPLNEICVNEARKAVKLIEITPRGDYASAWLLIPYFFAATTTLLHHTNTHPSHPQSCSDIQLIEPFLGLLEQLARESKSEEVEIMYTCCQDLNIKARAAVESANMKIICGASMANKRGGKEGVEDFIMRVECQSKGCPVANQLISIEGFGSRVPWLESWEGYGDRFDDIDMLDQ